MQALDPAQALLTAQIGAVTEALKFQYGLITLLIAGIGFRFSKSWPTAPGAAPLPTSRLVYSSAVCAGGALLVMLYVQHLLVQSIARRAITDFTTKWLSGYDIAVDSLIFFTAVFFALGWKK